MKRSLLFVCASLVLCFSFNSCRKGTATKTINVAGLFSLTGNWSTLGVNSKAAIEMAAHDINTYAQNKGLSFRLSVSTYDTRLNPDSARMYFVKATDQGSDFVIGPQSSAELANIVPLADAAKMIVVSQGSTAGSLALAGDAVFRFCPPDKVEGGAIANTIYNDGMKGLVTVARDDAGNKGLQSATGSAFVAKGGVVNAIDAYSTATTDFTTVIAAIKAKVNTLAAAHGIANVAVYLASFDEGVTLMAQAASDPILSQVQWYGGDGIVLSAVLPANTTASAFAVKTGFFAPSFGLPVSLQSKWQPVADRIKTTTGIDADAFALAAYDAMWVIAYTLEKTQGNVADFAVLKTVFAQQANAYAGVTGATTLDAFGDRATGAFDYWGIKKNGTAYNWVKTGTSE
ncbi:MAG: Extracellular ligand-binding receptor [Flavipsychrobacter sp.]|jgi:branched-chain amino acid transport system substrate-binding protein|nr:Extracellular ligand-binding receptor [Flavipsychrobacter sp.]